MTDTERIADLLLDWEDRREHGTAVSAEELCRDCPHLLPELVRRINALNVTSWMTAGDGDPPPEPSDPTAPPPLGGRYRLDGKIGEGGFAEVWKGYDLELRRAVAVKRPRPSRLGTTDRLERFVAEARRVAGLKHPGVVPVFDVGRDGDAAFIVSELVEGGSLAGRIVTARPSVQETVRLVAEVADTLAYAHRHGFLHRDIKPANILIDHHGRALVADFGIARSPDDGAEPTSFGTLAYMAPEQVEGKSADHRADLYSLGVVLYELLVGRLPHTSADPVALRREIVSEPPPLIPAGANVPERLVGVCLKCLSRDPAARYQNAETLAHDLRAALGLRPTGRRRRAVAVAGITALVALTAWGFFTWLPTPEQRPTSAEHEPPATLPAALSLGRLYWDNKQWHEAEAAFSEAIRLDPRNAEAHHRRAGCLVNTKRVEESLPDFDAAVRLDPENPEVVKNRGIARLNLLRFDDAIADLKHALALGPADPQPYRVVLGQAFAWRAVEAGKGKKWAEAVADFDEAIKLDPANAGYFDRRGSLKFNQRQFAGAVADFTEAIRLDPTQREFRLHRGYAHESLGKMTEAAEDYRAGRSP